LLDIECLTCGQIQSLAHHSDGGVHDIGVKSRNLRRAETIHQTGVFGADFLGLQAKHIGQCLSLIPGNRAKTSRELRDEAGGDFQTLSHHGLRKAGAGDGLCYRATFSGLGVGWPRHIAMLFEGVQEDEQRCYLLG